jgi:hypothetical protein
MLLCTNLLPKWNDVLEADAQPSYEVISFVSAAVINGALDKGPIIITSLKTLPSHLDVEVVDLK